MMTRMEQVKSGVTEGADSFNNVETVLQKYNMTLIDSNGNFKALGGVIDELGQRWSSLDKFQQMQLVTAIAGARQANSMLAMMDNYNNVLAYQTAETESAGLAQDRYNKYLQSAEAAANLATTAWQGMWSAIINSKGIIFLDNFSAAFGLAATSMLSFNSFHIVDAVKDFAKNWNDATGVIEKSDLTNHLTENTEAIKAAANPLYTNTELIKAQGAAAQGTGENLDYLAGIIDSLVTEMNKLTVSYSSDATAAEEAATSMQKYREITVAEEQKLIDAGYASAIMTDAKTGKITVNVGVLHALVVAEGQAAAQSLQSALNDAIRINATKDVTDKLQKELDVQNALNIAMGKNATLVVPTYGVPDTTAGTTAGSGETAAQKMKTLTNMVVSMIQEQKNAQKAALQDELASYKTFIDAQKTALDAQKTALEDETTAYSNIISAQKTELQLMHDKQNYEDTLAQNEKDLSNTQMQLNALALDNSEEAKAKRLTLQDTLAKQTTTINKTQSDEQYNNQQTALDNELTAFKANQQNKLDIIAVEQKALDGELKTFTDNINSQTKLIDDYLSKSGKMAQDALQMVHDKGSSLYQDLIKWNSVYGTGITADVTSAWEGATGAVQGYGAAVAKVKSSSKNIEDSGNAKDFKTGYSSGGLVTGGTPGQDSVSARLMPGEYVLTTAQVNSIGLPNLMNRGIPATTSNSGNGGNQISMPITVQGNLDKSVLPDLEAMITKTIGKLNSTMLSRGYKRNVSTYSS